jgi:NAD(P)-dependent dehydrogenase (short-subunit alcohol dehydrogenase family)
MDDSTTELATDQFTFADPVTRYPAIKPPKQTQEEPGLDSELEPAPDLGEQSYRGSGRLTGRKALITGADSGIGAAVAIAFAREGADVALAYLPEEETDAQRIVGLVQDAGRTAVSLPTDVGHADACRALVESAAEQLGGLDIVVNNAGKQVFVENLEELSDEQFDETLRTNLYSTFWITKAALKHLAPGSTVINTASMEAYKPSPILVDYATTKGAINTFTKSLAQQLAPRGIRVNAVAPGPVWTALQVSGGQPPEKIEKFGETTPLGRAGQPAELAPAYVFLASGESSFVAGETLSVSGGMPTP